MNAASDPQAQTTAVLALAAAVVEPFALAAGGARQVALSDQSRAELTAALQTVTEAKADIASAEAEKEMVLGAQAKAATEADALRKRLHPDDDDAVIRSVAADRKVQLYGPLLERADEAIADAQAEYERAWLSVKTILRFILQAEHAKRQGAVVFVLARMFQEKAAPWQRALAGEATALQGLNRMLLNLTANTGCTDTRFGDVANTLLETAELLAKGELLI